MTHRAHICAYRKSKVHLPLAEGDLCFKECSAHVMFHIDTDITNALLYCTSKALPIAKVVWFSPRPGTVLTVQALSEDDHKFWMQAMGGKEPVSQPPLLCHHLALTLGSCSFSVFC